MLAIVMFFFFFNDTATTEIYTLSLHDALPISAHFSRSSANGYGVAITYRDSSSSIAAEIGPGYFCLPPLIGDHPHRSYRDRKSTRLNSSHANISYAVFCLKKKKT